MKEIPEGLVKPENITEESFQKWLGFFLHWYTGQLDQQEQLDEVLPDRDSDCAGSIAVMFTDSLGMSVEDEELSIVFSKRFVPAIEAMIARTTYEFIKDQKQYEDFILTVNFLDKLDMAVWGVAIRGAWLTAWTDEEYIPTPEAWPGSPELKEDEDVVDYFTTLCALVRYYVIDQPFFEERRK
jgi:hypothetical protein